MQQAATVDAKVTMRVPSAAPNNAARDAVYADILSQAITGELVGMANYAAMVRLCPDAAGQMDMMEHGAAELRHAKAFQAAARKLGVVPIVNPSAPYWRRIRNIFLRYADAGDKLGCLIIQEVMLESFAVAMYRAVSEVENETLSRVFDAVAREEEAHADHAVAELRAELAADPAAFEEKMERLHDEVMTVLAQMLGSKDKIGHCELCRGSCVKGALPEVGLSRADMRGAAINHYLRTLDAIGVRGDVSLRWVARLPL